MKPTSEQIKSGAWRSIVSERMKVVGLNHYQLAKITGLGVTQVKSWLNGINEPSVSNYHRLITALYDEV
jgi:SOS-response transcriptional repressor LexA